MRLFRRGRRMLPNRDMDMQETGTGAATVVGLKGAINQSLDALALGSHLYLYLALAG